jgi:hypothetical protein
MTTAENYVMSCLALANDAIAPSAAPEIKRQAAAALRGLATVIEGNAPAALAANSAPAAAAATPAAATATPAAQPDFFSVLLDNLKARLPEIVPADELAKARDEARSEGFRMPAGIDLNAFVASQAKARA